ncbi:MAG: hypothetical protein QME60_00610 [Verrucomicrobiota bacterium]|nr:hypothetical protein [Verrucomicrobiota bacterium]
MKRMPAFFGACLVAVALARAAPYTADTLDTHATTYNKHAAEIESACRTRLAAIPDQYAKTLAELEATLIRNGDLEGVQAARKEKSRFEKDRDIPENTPSGTRPEIGDIQARFRKALTDALTDKHSRLAELTRLYLDRLDASQASLTVQNKIEEAIKVRAEIKKATFLLADALSYLDPPSVPEKPSTPTAPCRHCGGKGYLEEDCPMCKGKTICPGCNGSGKDLSRPTIRHALCRGSGKCPKCFGKGKLKTTCPVCATP